MNVANPCGASNGRWFAAAGVVCLCAVFCGWVVHFPLTNTDIWWHLAAAREMITRRGFLYIDPFSFTNTDAPWIDLHWLFQLGAYAVHEIGGAGALVFVKSLAAGAVCIILSLVYPSKRFAVITASAFALMLYEARYLVLARPTMVTLVCMGLFIALLERFRRTGKAGVLVGLPVIQVIWTNTQGLFILGPVICGAFVAESILERLIDANGPVAERKTGALGIAFGALVAATFVNPYGWRGALFPLKLFGRIDPDMGNIYSRNVSENMPLLELDGPARSLLVAVVVVTLIVVISFVINWKQPRWAHLLLFIAFLYLAYMAKRNVSLYFLIAAPILGFNVQAFRWPQPWTLRLRRGVHGAVAGVVVVLFLVSTVTWAKISADFPSSTALSPFRYPVDAVEFVKANPVTGRVFNAIRYGGYLLWEMYPERKVFIDGRLIIRTPRFFADYLMVCDNPNLFDQIAERYDIGWVAAPTAIFYRYMPLVQWLYRSDEWHLAFTDGSSVVFYRAGRAKIEPLRLSSEGVRDSIHVALKNKWGADPAIEREAIRYFDQLLAALEER